MRIVRITTIVLLILAMSGVWYVSVLSAHPLNAVANADHPEWNPCIVPKQPISLDYHMSGLAWSFDPGVFYGCAGAYLSVVALYSFAMGPGGPAFFFAGSSGVAVGCLNTAFCYYCGR